MSKAQIDECLNEHVFANLKEARDHRSMEGRLQHQPTAHEPQRAHTNRVRSTPQSGAKLEPPYDRGQIGGQVRPRDPGQPLVLPYGRSSTEKVLAFG